MRRTARVEPLPYEVFHRLSRSRRLVTALGWISAAAALLVFATAASTLRNAAPDDPRAGSIAMIEIFIGCFYLTPAIHLLRYGRAIRNATLDPDAAALEHALKCSLRYFRFLGVTVLVLTALAALGVLSALVMPLLWKGAAS